jgi:hypothetical protein
MTGVKCFGILIEGGGGCKRAFSVTADIARHRETQTCGNLRQSGMTWDAVG